jgi:glycosyltransferase involved in cell wall biosynthesis
MNTCRVALVMIVRNEAPRIVRALASVSHCVDEMVVLDTGSTDATVALARSAGARVGHFDWCDDFAAARNAALNRAAGAAPHRTRFRRHAARRQPFRHADRRLRLAQLAAARAAARRPLRRARA